MHRLKWGDLQFVHAVVEHGSLSAAARALSVNHATVQRRIGAIEARYGIGLFERQPDGYRLRPEGREILSALEAIGQAAGRIERSFDGVRRTVEGTFRLTTTDTIATLLLPKHLDRLTQTYPDVSLELAITSQRVDMTRPLAEIAIRPSLQLPADMSGERAGDLAFHVFGSAEYLAANESSDPSAHRWMGLAPSLRQSAPGIWQERNLPREPAVTADSFLALAAFAEAGMGLAMLPAFVGRAHGKLIRAAQFETSVASPLWVAAHGDLRRMEPIAVLVEFFAASLRADTALLG